MITFYKIKWNPFFMTSDFIFEQREFPKKF